MMMGEADHESGSGCFPAWFRSSMELPRVVTLRTAGSRSERLRAASFSSSVGLSPIQVALFEYDNN